MTSDLEKIAANAFLKALADRFRTKIDPKDYYLSYSGGKDSHFLLWFIKEFMKEDDIVIVGVNTGMELFSSELLVIVELKLHFR